MKRIPLSEETYAKLENSAKIRGLTPEDLAAKIILSKSVEKTCHNCGLESADNCPQKHIPADESLEVCAHCLRNPNYKDRWNECWTLNENNLPFVER